MAFVPLLQHSVMSVVVHIMPHFLVPVTVPVSTRQLTNALLFQHVLVAIRLVLVDSVQILVQIQLVVLLPILCAVMMVDVRLLPQIVRILRNPMVLVLKKPRTNVPVGSVRNLLLLALTNKS
jgi:hypothetical protein